jgi:CelD/BcsL family acetyltransferase involved in cellulose biosynthesis
MPRLLPTSTSAKRVTHRDSFEVTVENDLESLREAWSPLADACGNPFTTWEWASTWWQHFGEGREQQILVFRDPGGEIAGIVPLYFDSRRPLRVLRYIGHFPADELGPVCAPERRLEIAYGLARHLSERRDWDLALQERIPEIAGLREPLGARQLRTEAMPELRITAADWDEFLASKSSNFRGQVRTYERRLLRDNELEYRLCESPERLGEEMGLLFDLHRRGWQARGEDGAFPESLAAFHCDFAGLALERGWLRLWIATLDGEPAAAWYGFRLAGIDSYYQGGRDPERARESVGFVLMAHTLRDAVNSGIHTYRLLLGAEEYKKRFSDRVGQVETFATTRSVRGKVAVGALSARAKMRDRGDASDS